MPAALFGIGVFVTDGARKDLVVQTLGNVLALTQADRPEANATAVARCRPWLWTGAAEVRARLVAEVALAA